MIFFVKIVPNWGVFRPRRRHQVKDGTAEKVQYILATKESLLMSINEALLSRQNFAPFQVTKIKFCMKMIRTFNAQPVKIPHLGAC